MKGSENDTLLDVFHLQSFLHCKVAYKGLTLAVVQQVPLDHMQKRCDEGQSHSSRFLESRPIDSKARQRLHRTWEIRASICTAHIRGSSFEM